MKKSNNLYNYSIPKSGNEETSYFLTKGRITFFPFFLRLLLCGVIYTVSFFITAHYTEIYIYEEIGGGKVTDETIITLFRVTQVLHLYILPVLLLGFVSIQGAKRMHDINKSGWYILIPVYNIYLTFLNGTAGSNDYGIDPKPMPKVTYFDELDENLTDLKNKQGIENKNNKDYSFLLFLGIIIVIVALIYISSYKTQKAYNPISAEPTAKNEMHERSNTFNKKSNVTSETETINSKQSEKKKENNENSDLNLEID
jgi:uncharacterized membrane protein YhaH (DUF805 family)